MRRRSPSFAPPRPRGSRAALAGASLLAACVVALPLARGGVDLWAEAAATTVALAALLLVAGRPARVPVAALALLGVTALGLAQLVPLPPALHRLAPGAVRVFELSLAPLGLYPAARPLSLAPAATAREAAKAIACLAAFVAGWAVSGGRRRRDRVVAGLGLAGVAVAAAVLGLALAGAGPFVSPRFPFVNRNHLAASVNLSAFVALGLALRARGQARLLWLLAFAATGAVAFLSLSRGGILAFFLGAALFVALFVRARREERHAASPRALALVAGAVVVVLGLAAFLALGPVLARLGTLRTAIDDTRAQLWRPALEVVRDFPVLGVGRGAFADVFTGYQLENPTYQFTHIENEWLQAVLDLGIPGGLLLVGTFVWSWLAAARRRDLSVVELGLLAGSGAVAAQNAVDFSLGILGVALPFAVAMGLLARGQRAFTIRPGLLRAGVAALAVVAAACAAVAFRHGQAVDQRRIEAAQTGEDAARIACAVVPWHPADWFVPAVAGVRLSAERRCAEAMPWLVRAMALYPSAPAPHLGTARCLAGRDDAAARREYRLAILFGSDALAEAAARFPRLEDLLEIAPETPEGLLALGGLLEQARPRDAATVYARALDGFEDDRALLPLARVHARLGEQEDAVALGRRYSALHRSDAAGYAVTANALFRLGRDAEGEAELQRGLAASPGSSALLHLSAERAMAVRHWSEARLLADQIAPRTPWELADKDLLAARALAGQGRLGEAIERVRSAQAAQPERGDVLLTLAGLCEQAGRFDDAIEAVRRAAALPGTPQGTYAARIASLEARRANAAAGNSR